MARLIYSSITSLDGYVSDETGSFDWGVPDDEVHRFVMNSGARWAPTSSGGASTR
jgi:hypothetical protein